MKANYPEAHPSKMPKSYLRLPLAEQQLICDMMIETTNDLVNKALDKETAEVVDIMIKLMCIRLVDAFHFTEDDLWLFLGNWRPLLRWNNRLIKEGDQKEVINKRINEIFKNRPFPQEYVDGLVVGGKKSE